MIELIRRIILNTCKYCGHKIEYKKWDTLYEVCEFDGHQVRADIETCDDFEPLKG
jgi:DNA-directed RNA polymerase subunit RPC12/RpoP